MRRSVFIIRRVVFWLIATLTLTASAIAQEQPVLNVSNVEELYAAVNNPANAGAIVVLASGTYTLTAKDLNNQPRPNGGKLVLQPGMALVGRNKYVDLDGDGIWDPRDDNHDGFADTDPVRGLIFADPVSETIIDAVNLSGGGGGAVRVGLDNRVEKLTVRNTNRVSAGIDANLVPTVGGLLAEIRDCLVEDGQRGIRLRVAQDGIVSLAIVERNITRRNTGSFGQGIEIIIQDASNSSWDVTLRNNRVYANIFGLFVVGEGATNVRSHVLSVRNLYRENQLGLSITAGRDGANGNNTQFTSVDDAVLNNGGVSAVGSLGGGVLAIAGLISAGADLSSLDALDLQFIGTRWAANFEGTTRRDLRVYGALARAGLPGTNDTVRVHIRGATSDGAAGAFQFIDSQPGDSTNTDTLTIIGSNVAFIHTNVGIDPPPEELFSPGDPLDDSN